MKEKLEIIDVLFSEVSIKTDEIRTAKKPDSSSTGKQLY